VARGSLSLQNMHVVVSFPSYSSRTEIRPPFTRIDANQYDADQPEIAPTA
jgi:hypothetical protein